jgi:tripartite-type tricarboxylate transporter receptor subunit TctC
MVGGLSAWVAAVVAVFVALLPSSAGAQVFTGKTITLIVNYPPGGPTDIEGRVVALHLPDHIPGHPAVVVKNVGGGSGLLGTNQLGDAAPNGETLGFMTVETVGQILGNPGIRTKFSDFVLIGGVAAPLVVYMRKDTPPGIAVAADVMKAKDFKTLTLNVQSINTVGLTLALDLLGLQYQPVPAYLGLKEVETAILQNVGQMADTSLAGWTGSVEPAMSNVVLPLWQLSPRAKDGSYPRSPALPNVPTFEEFYASVTGGKSLAGDFRYKVLRVSSDPQLAMFRTIMMPPKAPPDVVAAMRAAFNEMWQDPQFLADYTKVLHTTPILLSGADGQQVLADLGAVPPEIKAFLVDYMTRMTSK